MSREDGRSGDAGGQSGDADGQSGDADGQSGDESDRSHDGDGRNGDEGADVGSDGDQTAGTVCPFCAVGCRLDQATESDGTRRVRGRAGPANPDGRLCAQGLHAFDVVDDDERLTEPLVRVDGELVAVDWETALDRAVAGVERVREARGPDALAFLGAPQCTTEENYLLQKLARALGTNNVDNRARRCHAATGRTVAERLGYPAMTNGLADLGDADVFLVVGANPAARQPVAFDGVVRPAVNGGATLVHVDPQANETTRLADRHLAPRPGTDGLVATLLCALLVARGAVDEAFVADRTTGYESFRGSLAAFGTPGSAAFASRAAAADVPVATLEAVADAVADADRTAVLTGTGVSDRATADALLNLCLLTGNVGQPGTGLNLLRGLANEQGASDVGCAPDRLPGHRPVDDPAARTAVAAAWDHSVPATPGKSERELVDSFGDEIGAALVVGENPAVSKRDPDRVARGLDALDTLVVTELAPTETTARADVVLPAAAGVEKAGTVTTLDRQVQRRRQLTDPPAGVRTDFAILRELGRRLVGPGVAPSTPRATFAELTRVTPIYGDLSFDELGRQSRRWPADCGEPDDDDRRTGSDGPDGADGDSVLYRESFRTESGLAPFAPVDPALAGPATDRDADGLTLVVADRVGGFGAGGAGSGGADGPTGQGEPRRDERLVVHPTDAAARGLGDGDGAAVATDAATVETTVRVSDGVRRGTVALHASVADPLVRGKTGERPIVALSPSERRE